MVCWMVNGVCNYTYKSSVASVHTLVARTHTHTHTHTHTIVYHSYADDSHEQTLAKCTSTLAHMYDYAWLVCCTSLSCFCALHVLFVFLLLLVCFMFRLCSIFVFVFVFFFFIIIISRLFVCFIVFSHYSRADWFIDCWIHSLWSLVITIIK